ncbi:MAG: flagellar filament capping protein FliD [Clostridium sp.]
MGDLRITGLATGLDMDQVIRDSMKPYRIKIDQQQQKKEIVEIKQKLYREVINDCRSFYNKYFDISSKDSLLLSSNYSTTKFTSSNENILTVTGGADSKVDNYKITGTTAKAATATVTENIKDGEKIVINGKEFTMKGSSQKEIATNLNTELKNAGINVSVNYTSYAGNTTEGNKSGLIFESTVLGKDNSFTIGGTVSPIGSQVVGKDPTASKSNVFTMDELKNSGGKISINGEEIDLEIKDTDTNEDIKKKLNQKLSSSKIRADIDESGNITFSSTELGSKLPESKISIGGKEATFTAGEDGTKTINTLALNDVKGQKISINGTLIDLSKAEAGKEVEYINKMLSGKGIEAKLDGEKIVFESSKIGSASTIEINKVDSSGGVEVKEGTDSNIIFTDSKGGVYVHSGNSNTVTIDGVTFKFTGEIPKDTEITVNGKKDVTQLKDKIVNFVNDYNNLIENLNTMVKQKPNKDFMPLTDEQKKEMSEDEIKLWNEKVKQGQLSRDSDITRIINNLKNTIVTPVSSNGLNFEKIGIMPVGDYAGTKNGTFTIDEEKLTKALEENAEEVMNLFIGQPVNSSGMNDAEKYNSTGVFHRMKDILYKETVSVSSSLIKKAGIEGSSSVSNNTLTKSIEAHEKKIKDMEKDFKRREQDLYSKYARLEVMMNKYNSQQSYLMSQMGGM